uniref:Elongation factor 1-beta n=1 Tax=Rhabditophanes sp. KR3021 TaxID=114890 RepID=A0AC35U1S0_9BILA
MSIESLLSEVTPFFYHTVAVKAGVATNDQHRPSTSGEHADLGAIKESQVKLAGGIEEIKALLQKLSVGGVQAAAPAKVETVAPVAAAADDDFDLFDSDEESDSEAKKKITEERLKAYHAKKATKTAVIAKSSVILDIKPWDDTTDMAKMEEEVKKITMDGLVWGGAKLIPLAYGIKKLQIIIVIEDDKVSTEDLIELITTDLEDYVQSVDIHAFNKI